MSETKWKVPKLDETALLPRALLSAEQEEDAVRYLLDRWQDGELSTRDVAGRLSLGYYDFIEFASKRQYSVVPTSPDEDGIAAYRRSAGLDR